MDRSYLDRWASLTVPVDNADPGRGSRYDLAAPGPLAIASGADPSTLRSGGVAIATAVDPSANLPGGQAC